MQETTPPRPDLQYRPEVVQIAAPRRKVWPWVLGTALVLLLLGGLGNLAEQDQTTTPSAPITQPVTPVTGSAGISAEDQAAADIAWNTLSVYDQTNVCLAETNLPRATAVQAFADGADMSYAEAEPIVEYIWETYC